MAAGAPLNDDDRAPWLAAIHDYIDEILAAGKSAVVTCSALKESYRQILRGSHPANRDAFDAVQWVYLKGDPALLLKRLEMRRGHFMKPEMLQSQLATLEEPRGAIIEDTARSPQEIVAHIRGTLGV